jgi:predicted extracellular nuclease
VIEVEKETLLVELADLLADTCGFTYDVTHQESADARGIDVAMLTDPRQVVVQSNELRQTCTAVDTGIIDDSIECPAGEFPLSSRPPLQANVTIDGREYIVYVNHFKSKRGGELETAPQRLAQAQFLQTLVEEELAQDPEARLVVLGDFNDYEQSPTLLEMTKDGRLTNLLARVPIEQRYSFVFSGAAQLLDGLLVSPILVNAVDSVSIQHVNADFPAALATDPQSAYHATDHDLPLMVLNLAAEMAIATAVPPPTPSGPVAFNGLWLVVALGGLAVLGGTAVFLRRKS